MIREDHPNLQFPDENLTSRSKFFCQAGTFPTGSASRYTGQMSNINWVVTVGNIMVSNQTHFDARRLERILRWKNELPMILSTNVSRIRWSTLNYLT